MRACFNFFIIFFNRTEVLKALLYCGLLDNFVLDILVRGLISTKLEAEPENILGFSELYYFYFYLCDFIIT